MEVVHAQPRLLEALIAQLPPSATTRLAMTTWETYPFPDAYAQALSQYAGVIVPSTFCEEVMNSHDMMLRAVHVVPHCFDEGFWPEPRAREREPRSKLRFYTIGAWGERKNPLGILRAYLHEFSSADDVELMMLVDGADFDAIRMVISRAGILPDDLPPLYIPQHALLTERELVMLHQEADCFVSAARGEGWGLGLFEAAISGRRVISTLAGGQRDFLGLYGGLDEVSTFETPCFGANTPGVTAKQLWAEPNLSMLGNWMRALYDRGEKSRPYDPIKERRALEARFGYKTVGPQLAQLLKGLSWQPPSLTSSTS